MKEILQERWSVLERLRASNDGVSPGHRRLAAYLLGHHKQAAFETAAQLGRRVGVSEATVVRFAAALGYRGFPEFQRVLRGLVLQELTTLDRLRDQHVGPTRRGRTASLEAVVRQERENVGHLLRLNSMEACRSWVRALAPSRSVAAVGMQSSASLAQFFAFHLGKARPGVSWFGSAEILAYHHVARMTRQDALCVFTFPRYPRAIVELAHFARDRNLRLLVMTDSDLSPVAGLGTATLYAPTRNLSFVDGYAAPIALINAVLSELARSSLRSVRRSLAAYEKAAKRASVFVQH